MVEKAAGKLLAATLITPCMPVAICGKASASSPLTTRKSEGRSRRIERTLRHVAAGFFDARDIGQLGQPQDGIGIHIAGGAGRHII